MCGNDKEWIIIFADVLIWGIAHSLGAHLLGLAGRHSGHAFDRITGLDPAGR